MTPKTPPMASLQEPHGPAAAFEVPGPQMRGPGGSGARLGPWWGGIFLLAETILECLGATAGGPA